MVPISEKVLVSTQLHQLEIWVLPCPFSLALYSHSLFTSKSSHFSLITFESCVFV